MQSLTMILITISVNTHSESCKDFPATVPDVLTSTAICFALHVDGLIQ